MNSKSKIISSIRLFRTSAYACSYIADKKAATVFVDPEITITRSLNTKLSDLGYRRSGAHLYRPDWDFCSSCISCRVPVADFRMRRRHRKTWNRNADLVIKEIKNIEAESVYRLYKSYINSRHQDGDMYPATPEQYAAFIKTRTPDTRYYGFYLDDNLVAVSVTDLLEHGLSAVYTFFDTSLDKRSLGNFVILWQIHLARQMQLDYVFLGYWIKDCAKMQYKTRFRPIELLLEGKWMRIK